MPRVTTHASAPHWRDLKAATADGKVSRKEVLELIKPHTDSFGDSAYRKAVTDLRAKGSDVRLGFFGARSALDGVIREATSGLLKNAADSAIESGSARSTPVLSVPPELVERSARIIGTEWGKGDHDVRLYIAREGRLWAIDARAVNDETSYAFAPREVYDCGLAPADVQLDKADDFGRMNDGYPGDGYWVIARG